MKDAISLKALLPTPPEPGGAGRILGRRIQFIVHHYFFNHWRRWRQAIKLPQAAHRRKPIALLPQQLPMAEHPAHDEANQESKRQIDRGHRGTGKPANEARHRRTRFEPSLPMPTNRPLFFSATISLSPPPYARDEHALPDTQRFPKIITGATATGAFSSSSGMFLNVAGASPRS
ncbi:MAG: hypothetical protein HYU78_14305 [Rhodocyclales bacterium]|nr:hypothetical protein [Rhodocyclales bacterium]